jgi:hypothetical protein
MTTPTRIDRSKHRRRIHLRREGAVMLVVMVMLLVSTATAIVAVHGTTYEIRASGHFRQAMQTQYVAETGLMASLTWVDSVGVPALLQAMERVRTMHPVVLEPFEPNPLPGQNAYRLYVADLAQNTSAPPFGPESFGGATQANQPYVAVDVYDTHVFTGAVAGQRSDGGTPLRFLRATYTSRGRTHLGSEMSLARDSIGDRPRNETASDARARGVSGPFAL